MDVELHWGVGEGGSEGAENHFAAICSVDAPTKSVGYASSSRDGDPFGLEKTEKIEQIEIRWPSGIVQKLEDVPSYQVLLVREADRSTR